MQRIWWLLGWIFFRHWNRLAAHLSWYSWVGAIKRWCWATKGPLIKHRLRHFVWRALYVSSCHCPHCRYEGWTDHDDLFALQSSGGNSWGGYWFEGLQTCARCGTTHEYGDSD